MAEKLGSWGSEDKRPLWIIWFDRVLWIILLGMVAVYGYEYFFGFTNVTVYDCSGENYIGGGKVKSWTFNITDWQERGYKVIENQEKYVKQINDIKLTNEYGK